MLKTSTIDYMQYSIPEPPDKTVLINPITPQRFYKFGYQDPNTGIRYYTGNPKSPKWLVIESGTALSRLEHMSVIDHARQLQQAGAVFSRIDLAIDCHREEDDIITVSEIMSWYQEGLIQSKHAKYDAKTVYNAAKANHETLYIGDMSKRGKKGIFRAYDKGVERGLLPNYVTRFELELKRDDSKLAVRRLQDHTIEQVFASKFNIDHERWKQFIDSEPATLTRDKSQEQEDEQIKLASRWQWLITTIAPSLGRSIAQDALHGKLNNYELFNSAVEKAYREYMQDNA